MGVSLTSILLSHTDSALQEGLFGPLYVCLVERRPTKSPKTNSQSSASFPVIPGHEAIGNIVAVGPGEKKWKEGDLVGAPWHGGHDGTCKKTWLPANHR